MQVPEDLATFTEEIIDEKLHLCGMLEFRHLSLVWKLLVLVSNWYYLIQQKSYKQYNRWQLSIINKTLSSKFRDVILYIQKVRLSRLSSKAQLKVDKKPVSQDWVVKLKSSWTFSYSFIVWKMYKYGAFSGPCFPLLGLTEYRKISRKSPY